MDLISSLPGPFSSWRLKYLRAEQHLRDYDSAAQWFEESHPWDVGTHFDDQAGENVFIVSHVKPVPIEISLILGDAFQAFRSALDHAVWDIVQIECFKPPDWAQFPIYTTRTAYKKNLWKLGGVRPDTLALIEGLQPYDGMDDGGLRIEDKPLAILHRLNNSDKHRVVHLTAAMLIGSDVRIQGVATDISVPIGSGILSEGTEIARVAFGSLDSEMNVSFHFPTEIALSGEIFHARLVSPLILDIKAAVLSALTVLAPLTLTAPT